MATVITRECINCGACESECPNTAIYPGGVEWVLNDAKHAPLATDIFYIVPEKCTECVGFFDQEACAAVCPVDCCVPDPAIPESEEQLLARARQLHPEHTFPPDFPSRFRKAGAVAPVALPPAAAPELASLPAASPSPPSAPPAEVPSVPPPAVAPAPPPPVASPARETRPDAESSEQAAHAAPKPQKRFAGELDEDFDLLLKRLQQPTGDASRARFGALAALLRPLRRRLVRAGGEGDTGRCAGPGGRIPVSGTIPFDGFYAGEFDEKRDRLRRYGEVYAVTDLGRGYLVRLEFPQRVPPSSTKEQLRIGDEMPDYDYDLHLSDGSLVVRGRLVDPRLRKLASGAPSLPPDFTVRIELAASARGFKHRYRDKVLEVAVVK